MGDPIGVYVQVLNWASHLLLWTKGNPPSECRCHCEVAKSDLDSCAGIVKDLVQSCLETSLAVGNSITTTTTTRGQPVRAPLGLWWLVILLILAHTVGFVLGHFARIPARVVKQSQTRALPISPASTDSSVSRARRGVAA